MKEGRHTLILFSPCNMSFIEGTRRQAKKANRVNLRDHQRGQCSALKRSSFRSTFLSAENLGKGDAIFDKHPMRCESTMLI